MGSNTKRRKEAKTAARLERDLSIARTIAAKKGGNAVAFAMQCMCGGRPHPYGSTLPHEHGRSHGCPIRKGFRG